VSSSLKQYSIYPAPATLVQSWKDASAWREFSSWVSVDQFHPAGSDHRPRTQAGMVYTADGLLARFEVADRFVKSLATNYQDMVCFDSCVELFLQPKPTSGYFNFEVNCGGTMLLYYIEDATRLDTGGLRKYRPVAIEDAAKVEIATTMPRTVPVEITEPVEWSLALRIPFAVMEPYVGKIGDVRGQTWRGNLYKCGDKTSHPHWASWAPIGETLSFHQPERFGKLVFE
jgi:hypothetical protein